MTNVVRDSSSSSLGILFALVLNGAANVLPINGLTTAEISDRFRVFVTPPATCSLSGASSTSASSVS